jgi:hypothetical protein
MMLSIFRRIFDWSEVWALLIPLTVLIICKPKPNWLKPVKWYLITALLLNVSLDLVWYVNKYNLFDSYPGHRWNNNIFYNLNSMARLLYFAWFFNLLQQRFMHRIKAIIPYVFIIFLLINFIFFENLFPFGKMEVFSTRLLATESAFLLFYCLQYYIYLIVEEKTTKINWQPGFWIVLGLSIYVAVNFFIFLFYDYLSKMYDRFAVNMWDVHNIVFILLCLFIVRQFKQECKKRS